MTDVLGTKPPCGVCFVFMPVSNGSQEIPLAHFMDMAYDMDRHTTPDTTTEWLERWSAKEFGANIAQSTTEILNDYGTLVGRRKYELH